MFRLARRVTFFWKKVTKKAFPQCLGLRLPVLFKIGDASLTKYIPVLGLSGVLCTSKFAPVEFVTGLIPDPVG